jgi:glycosyltransferase involved in cell wall biosynthesis
MTGAPVHPGGRPIVFDATRLLTRIGQPAPTGIDRVDLAYLRHVRPRGAQTAAIVRATARILPGARTDKLIGLLAERWRDEGDPSADPTLAAIRRWLAGTADQVSAGPALRPRSKLSRIAEAQLFKADAFRWRRAAEAPRDAIYLHTSHLRLDRPNLFQWLEARPDIRPVFFVHDLIPIDFPEYGVPGEAERHLTRMETVARHAAAVIVNSADVGDRFAQLVARKGWRAPPITVAPLGVEDAFLGEVRRGVGGRPYFVVCSTIEGRKNHLLLLQIWREMARTADPEQVPALVIVGKRGWESEAATDLLDRAPALKGNVFEASGLSTPALAELVAGARALLMPSFTEGYGIPVVEALSVGTPVIASDLPVFREIAGGHATLVHPLDGPGWLREVWRLGSAVPDERPPQPYDPPTWAAHFRIVDTILGAL